MTKRNKSELKFVGLHGHSTSGSPFDAIGYANEHMDFAFENGMNSLALTDHGNMNGYSYQYLHAQKMNKQGIDFKPIYGVEAYFHPSIEEWKNLKEETDKEKKTKKKAEEASGAVSEDEGASKKRQNPLNKRNHLVLLAKNQKGLNNIFKLVSESSQGSNYYRFPRIDYDLLTKHHEGVIASSACLGGIFAGDMWDHYEESDEIILNAMRYTGERFKNIFGDRFYGELQWIDHIDQHRLNKFIIRVCDELNIPLICTADSHYPRPELWKDRSLYKKLNPNFIDKEIGNPLPTTIDEVGYELYPKNGDQMFESYKKYSERHDQIYEDDLIVEAIERTHQIAYEQIENFEPDTTVVLPNFVVPEGKNEDDALRELVYRRLSEKGIDDTTPKYAQVCKQLDHELQVIKDRKFSKYFLTTDSITDMARRKMLLGPGRGSGGGSLVLYTLGITQVDPSKYGLMFSRFMRSNQTDYPDIDMDFSRNDDLKELLIDEWGTERVAPISNWNTLKLKTLVSDISKFYGIEFAEVKSVTTVMEKEATPAVKKERGIKAGVIEKMTFDEVRRNSTSLQKFLEKYPQVATHIDKLYGQIKSNGTHAGGVIISENLSDRMPLIRSKNITKSPWSEGQNVRHLEPLGFIKFDLLGLSTLEMFEDCISLILKNRDGKEPEFSEVKDFYDAFLHPDILDFDDQKVYENTFHKKNFIGIFQFAEKGMQSFAYRSQPRSLIDVSAITSIWRPGPMSSNVPNTYVEAINNPDSVQYKHPILKELIGDTYGMIIFQEQLALLANSIGKDISLEEGNLLRKVLTKKGTGKTKEVVDSLYSRFIEGAIEKGIEEKLADEIWQQMKYFAAYGFNKSHAVCYSVISYQCAYLLTHYPAEWCCAYLNQQNEDKKADAISEVQSLGFNIGDVDINESDYKWKPSKDGKTLIQPLTTVKGLGKKGMIKIIENRPYENIDEMLFDKERKVDKKSMDVLIRVGALDFLMDERFSNRKHFWMSCVFNGKPTSQKKFVERLEEYQSTEDFTRAETIDFIQSLTGIYPLDMVLSNKSRKAIEKHKATPISNRKDEELVWFIPVEVLEKKTKRGGTYYVVMVTDSTGKRTRINCWGVDRNPIKIYKNRVYMSIVSKSKNHLVYDSNWSSYSASNAKNCFIMLG